MFEFFERILSPTATPENPEPPATLVAFLWHFARQAKWLFAALFVVELMSALTDSAVPWFMGRVVTLVTKTPPDRLFAAHWPLLVGIVAFVVIVRPAVTLMRYLISNQAIAAPFTGLIRWQSHWHVAAPNAKNPSAVRAPIWRACARQVPCLSGRWSGMFFCD